MILDLSVNPIGSIKNKPNIINILDKYRTGLNMLSVIHMAGAKKYELYSWINRPEQSNSTITDNLNALYRHFSAHSMGKFIDEEGFPHIFHLCCRAGMLITTFYRVLQQISYQYTDTGFEYRLHPQSKFITPEEIYSLIKYEYPLKEDIQEKYNLPTDEVSLRSFLNTHLLACMFDYAKFQRNIKMMDFKNKKNKELLNEVFEDYNDLDVLFRAILCYAEIVYDEDMFKLIDRKKVGVDLWMFTDEYIN